MQSLTLPAAVVHCSKEFTPGLVYVALSQVKTSQHLQVLNFSPDQLLQPSQDCLDVCVSNQNMGDSTGNCCAQIALAPSKFTVDEASDKTVTETDEENSEIADITDKVVKAYFNRKENDDVAISDIQTDMETNMADDLDHETISMLLMSEEGHMLLSRPMWFKIKEILQDMKVPSSVVESSEGAAKSKNEVIDNLLKNDEQVELFGSILWSQCYQIVVKESPSSSENLEISETVV